MKIVAHAGKVICREEVRSIGLHTLNTEVLRKKTDNNTFENIKLDVLFYLQHIVARDVIDTTGCYFDYVISFEGGDLTINAYLIKLDDDILKECRNRGTA